MDVSLLLIETNKIQEYIFGSNHLAQNIGASEIVYRSTTKWLLERLKQLDIHSNVEKWDPIYGLKYHPSKAITDEDIDAEVVYANGGNALVIFKEHSQARAVVSRLTNYAFRHARGLRFTATLHDIEHYDDDSFDLPDEIKKLRKAHGKKKGGEAVSLSKSGLSVTSTCVFTGQPAAGVETDPNLVNQETVKRYLARGDGDREIDPRRISLEAAHKINFEHKAKKRLALILPDVEERGYRFVLDFGEFGTEDESSYIAVIHADGNQMGKRIMSLPSLVSSNREYIKLYREFSRNIAENSVNALQKTVDALMRALSESGQAENEGHLSALQIPAAKPEESDERKKTPLPFRPLVFGGDDVTFVADGRLGLDMAAEFIDHSTQDDLPDGKPLKARAGVAIVKTHYPFSRAYDLADNLSSSAKKYIKEIVANPDTESANVIDWHYSTSGVIFDDLDELREREYSAEGGKSLLMRPLSLEKDATGWKSWNQFQKFVAVFRSPNKKWADKRNKLFAMRSALRHEGEYPLFIHNFRLLKDVADLQMAGETFERVHLDGWDNENRACPYFDPLEALDYFYPLEAPEYDKQDELEGELA